MFYNMIFMIIFEVFSQTINKIEVNGNKRISKETIIVIGDIKIDKIIDDNEINNSLNTKIATYEEIDLWDGNTSERIFEEFNGK